MSRTTCIVCNAPLRPTGPPMRYCSARCRQAAYRARKSEVFAGIDPPVAGADPDEQVAQAVASAFWLAAELERLGRDASPGLAWRCTKISEDLLKAITKHFPDLVERADAETAAMRERLSAMI